MSQVKAIGAALWFNYRTSEYDAHVETPPDLHDYIPQIPAAQNMYNLLLEMGHSPLEAMVEVLLPRTADGTPKEG